MAVQPQLTQHLKWLPPEFFTADDMAVLQTVHQPKDHMRKLAALAQTPEAQERAIAVTIIYKRLRHALRRIFHAFIWRKIAVRTAAANVQADDPVTLEPIRKPVHITDIPGRWCYTFEASTVYNSIRAQLRNCSYGWPTPVAPRNPYTNSPLKWQQIWSARCQLLAHGLACWELEAFIDRSMKTDPFLRSFGPALYQDMQLRGLMERENADACQRLADFIEEMGDYTGEEVDDIHLIAFNMAFMDPRMCDHPYLVAWKLLYRRYLLSCPDTSFESSTLIHFNNTIHRDLQSSARLYLQIFDEFYRDYIGEDDV